MTQRVRVAVSLVLGALIAEAGVSGASDGDWLFAIVAFGVAAASCAAAAICVWRPAGLGAETPVALYITVLGVGALAAGIATGGTAFRVFAIVTGVLALALGGYGLRSGARA